MPDPDLEQLDEREQAMVRLLAGFRPAAPPDELFKRIRDSASAASPRSRLWLFASLGAAAAAAVVAAVVLWGVFGEKSSAPLPPTAGTPANPPLPIAAKTTAQETIRQTLADGSQVIFQKGSQWCKFDRVEMKDERTGESRRVRLVELAAGRAQFDVAKDADPFIVKTPACSVQVTGTQFEVNVAKENEKGDAKMTGNKWKSFVTVAVMSGAVAVFNLQGQVSLGAGEQANVKEGQAPGKTNIDALAAMFTNHYKPVKVEVAPAIPAYDLPLDLSKVSNFDAVNAKLKLDQCKELLNKNGFAVMPWESRGGNPHKDFQDAYKAVKEWEVPVFVTSDSMLHLYHIQFDETLKDIEERVFAADLQAMLEAMQKQLSADYAKADGDLKAACGLALGQISVSLQLLTDTGDTLDKLKQARDAAGKLNPPKTDWKISSKFSTDHNATLEIFREIGKPLGVQGPYPGNQAWQDMLAAMDKIIAHVEKQAKAAAEIKLPDEIRQKADKELELIAAHQGFAVSPLFDDPSPRFEYQEDYSQYVPRGHYTRSELLERYFKSMMYLGRMTYLIKGAQDTPKGVTAIVSTAEAKRQTIAAAIMTKLLTAGQAADSRKLSDIWQRIYAVTAYYVGVADDLSFTDYADALAKVIGKDLDAAKLLDDEKFFDAKVELAKLRGPAIYSGTGNIMITDPLVALAGKPSPEALDKVLDATMGLRIMGQRFVPDSYVMGKMVFPTVQAPTGGGKPWSLGEVGTGPKRAFPRSLDVMNAFGSDKAGELLKDIGDTAYRGYEETAGDIRGEFDKLSSLDWNRNLYWSWIWSLKGLNLPVGKGYPSFMQTEGWQDRQLYATSASWSQLRHDTILYAKQSYTGRAGAAPARPKDVPGYVEPSAEFYGRLLALNQMTVAGLNQMKVLDDAANKRLASLDAIIRQLLDISIKELANKELTKEEYGFIKNFGGQLTGAIGDLSEKARDTRIVADVHTNTYTKECVEEATGPLDWVVVVYKLPDGTLGMGVGPTLSYYEFKHPISDRLTDEAWQKSLETDKAKAAERRPNWTGGFLAPVK